jgi:hypothetical protein
VRIFFTSLMAFFLSAFVGGMVAQILAVWTNAAEEYILVFMAIVLIVMAVTFVFFVAQFFSNAAVNWAAICLLAAFAVMLLGLLGWTFSQPPAQRALKSDLAIIGGLMLPGVTVIVVQWLIVRWRAPRPAEPRFGRGTQPL